MFVGFDLDNDGTTDGLGERSKPLPWGPGSTRPTFPSVPGPVGPRLVTATAVDTSEFTGDATAVIEVINDQTGSNQPPVLTPIAEQSVVEGALLTFSVQATDPDPGQTLTYSLIAAPEGAQIGHELSASFPDPTRRRARTPTRSPSA